MIDRAAGMKNRIRKICVLVSIGVALAAVAGAAMAQSNSNEVSPSQQNGSGDSTLEISPQPGMVPPKPSVQELPSDRTFKPGDDTSSIDRNFRPDSGYGGGGNERGRSTPYLGLSVEAAIKCYKGFEEYSLEVISIDPHSPAAVAGLRARTSTSGMAATAATLAGLAGPLGSLAANALITKSCAGEGDGDLIVGIDDQRIHNRDEMSAAMARLKPGDVVYLNVVRPTGGCNHKTLRIPVRLGDSANPLTTAQGR
jgi:hypothetical protein